MATEAAVGNGHHDDEEITAPIEQLYAPLPSLSSSEPLPFFIESITPPVVAPSSSSSSSARVSTTGRFLCTARARSQFGALFLSRVSMYEIILPSRAAPALQCHLASSSSSSTERAVAWRTLLTLPNQPAAACDATMVDTNDAFAMYRASCPPFRVISSSSSSSSASSSSSSQLTLCHRASFRPCYNRPHYDETLTGAELCSDIIALQYPYRALPSGIKVRTEREAVQQRRSLETIARQQRQLRLQQQQQQTDTKRNAPINDDRKRTAKTKQRSSSSRPTMIRTPIFDQDDDTDDDEEDDEGDATDDNSGSDDDDKQLANLTDSDGDDDEDEDRAGEHDRVTLMMHINYTTWHITPLAATYSWQPVSHVPACTIIGIHGPSGRWRLSNATRLSGLYTKLCSYDRILNKLVAWPDMQLIDTWTVRHGPPSFTPGEWSDTKDGNRPSDNPAMVTVMNMIMDHISVRTLAAVIVDYLAVASRMFFCRRSDGSLCLFEPSLERIRDLPSTIRLSSIPHSRTGRIIASTCQHYMAHVQQVTPKKRRQGVTMRLTIRRFGQPPQHATETSVSHKSTFVYSDIPVSPYELRVWYSYDARLLYFSFISDGARSSSWRDPVATDSSAVTAKRNTRMRDQCNRGLWSRRIVAIDLATWEIRSVTVIPLTVDECNILCGHIITAAPAVQLGDPGQAVSVADSYSSALHEHIYRSLHIALGRQSLPRIAEGFVITCSSHDHRRHLVVDRFDQLQTAQSTTLKSVATAPVVKSRVWMVDIAECGIYHVMVSDDIDSDRLQWHRSYVPGSDETGSDL